jgi:hypothetical protein
MATFTAGKIGLAMQQSICTAQLVFPIFLQLFLGCKTTTFQHRVFHHEAFNFPCKGDLFSNKAAV